MSIKLTIDELNKLKNELNQNNIINKKLRKRIKDIENEITGYLKDTNQQGLKYKGQAYIIEEQKIKKIKNKKNIIEDITNLFKTKGIDNPEKMYDLIENIKRNEINVKKLKLIKNEIK